MGNEDKLKRIIFIEALAIWMLIWIVVLLVLCNLGLFSLLSAFVIWFILAIGNHILVRKIFPQICFPT